MQSISISKTDLFDRLGTFVKLENMCSFKTGEAVRNQFKVTFKNGTMFQSYDQIIAAMIGNQLYVNNDKHDYSRTTSMYCKKYCGLSQRERQNGINEGQIIDIR